MTAPMTPDEARLRELAEALKFFGRYATETEDDARIRRNTNLIHASQAILALLDALSSERERGDRAVGLLGWLAYPKHPRWQDDMENARAFLATQKAEEA